jgi:hypothetical protein
MNLQNRDLHWEYSRNGNRLKCFDNKGGQILDVECRNRTTADGQLGHDGNLPPGEYILGVPVPKNTVPFGSWFIPILDAPEHSELSSRGRSGLGIHGGGTGLPSPFSPHQGWQVTHGCLRIQNAALIEVVHWVQSAQGRGGTCYLTVVPDVPGAAEESDDWGPAVELFPDE